jgi:hypothetical protein
MNSVKCITQQSLHRDNCCDKFQVPSLSTTPKILSQKHLIPPAQKILTAAKKFHANASQIPLNYLSLMFQSFNHVSERRENLEIPTTTKFERRNGIMCGK